MPSLQIWQTRVHQLHIHRRPSRTFSLKLADPLALLPPIFPAKVAGEGAEAEAARKKGPMKVLGQSESGTFEFYIHTTFTLQESHQTPLRTRSLDGGEPVLANPHLFNLSGML